MNRYRLVCVFAALLTATARAQSPDWLVDPSPYEARVELLNEGRDLVLSNGLIRRTWRLSPEGAGACIAIDDLVSDRSLLRAVRAEARLRLDGIDFEVGGLEGQPNHAYLKDEWLEAMRPGDRAWRLTSWESGEIEERFNWRRVRHHAPDAQWPPPGVHLKLHYALPESGEPDEGIERLRQVGVTVHVELYDGLPLMSKWLTVENESRSAITIDRFTSEILAVVEESSWVETREGVALPRPSSLHVETDFAFGGFNPENANRHVVHWRLDPEYATQVNYLRQTPCLLVVEPTYGPAQTIAPGETFESYRTFELVYDSTDRERRGLALRRMYRTIAPWVTENPLMMHMRTAAPDQVREAIDQCAAVGFEMLILSFGSGFDIENESPEYLSQWREIAEYARSQDVEIGGYSLLSSRRIGNGQDIVSPEGQRPTHGNCPALTSDWGQDYFRKLTAFFEATGFTLLEHDGSYPGDVDVTPRPPLQKGEADSRWAQWQVIKRFYEWCRGEGIYLNVPDYYFLVGSNKCGMGYREVNWSLPRSQQVIHTRQNIFDGTWTKTPSMGWMFVPLTEYHGGGAAATIEPLAEHLDHYGRMIDSNLAFGVQACYRGPRLFDTSATKEAVASRVAWFKRYRDILESDGIHGRRADGRDLDWMLHVNPKLARKGMLIVFNPLEREVTKKLRIDVHYTGLRDRVSVSREDAGAEVLPIASDETVALEVTVPGGGFTWVVLRQAP
ncbi:MAG: alpha-galactosidase [Planctomycetota bacterium]